MCSHQPAALGPSLQPFKQKLAKRQFFIAPLLSESLPQERLESGQLSEPPWVRSTYRQIGKTSTRAAAHTAPRTRW